MPTQQQLREMLPPSYRTLPKGSGGVTASLVELGDVDGHPFHGNQWTDVAGSDDPNLRGMEVNRRVQAAMDGAYGPENRATDVVHDHVAGVEGRYTAERERIHQEIITEILRANASVPKDAEAVIMGGLMGAGKSTSINSDEFREQVGNPADFLVINPDDIKEMLAERGMAPDVPGVKPLEGGSLTHDESSKIAYDLAAQAQMDGTNILWDISMSSPGSVTARIQELTDEYGPHYHVTQVFVDVKVETAQERLLSRYAETIDNPMGGRYLDPQALESMRDPEYGSTNRATFEAVKPLADNWLMFNSEGTFSEGPKLVDQMPVAAALELGEAEGHPFRGNQYTDELTVTWEGKGEVGNLDHMTRREEGRVATSVIANLRGGAFEMPGGHGAMGRQGDDWQTFLDDIRENGIRNPIHIVVDYGREPRIHEGNSRRDAAVELQLKTVPVEIVYFGHAERQSTLTGSLEFGEGPGHPFRGNQYTGGQGDDQDFEEKYGNKPPSGDGDCYQAATKVMLEHSSAAFADSAYKLVHGNPEGRGEIAGIRFGHAWVEHTEEISGHEFVTVIDKANGQDVELPRDLYYHLGKLTEDDVQRYTFEEATVQMLKTEHYGPWNR